MIFKDKVHFKHLFFVPDLDPGPSPRQGNIDRQIDA